jgi:membrane fusion protein (multidrug efflux system)
MTWHPLLSLALVPLLGLGFTACHKADSTPRGRPPPLVLTLTVAAQDVPIEAQAPVDLRPLLQAEVGAKSLGYLDAVLVDRGDKVRRGQLLALVRPSDLPDQLAAARGALAQTQAALTLARANAERAQKLAPEGVVSEQDLQQSRTALLSAEAAQRSAQAQLGALAVRLGEHRIESPLDGVVLGRRLDPGALVGPQSQSGAVLTVAQVDTLRVFIPLSERDAPRIALGQDAHVEVDALPGRRFSGKVVRLAPAFDTATRTLDAEVHLPNPKGELRPGMYGRGAIVIETHRAVPTVPDAAVQVSGDRAFVFVLSRAPDKDKNADPQAVARRRPVTLGAELDGGARLEVRAGLAPGEEIVIAGTDGLSDGAQVRVRAAAADRRGT